MKSRIKQFNQKVYLQYFVHHTNEVIK